MEQKSRQVIAFIPLRGGSKSIPLKNIRKIADRPLAYWVLDTAAGCNLIDKIYVSTDSDSIKGVIENYGNNKIEVIGRSRETATDLASTESAMIEFARNYGFTHIVLIQATSPLLEAVHLTEGIEKYFDDKVDSLVSVVRQKRFIWKENEEGFIKPLNYNPLKRPPRQKWEGFLVENGAFYITSKKRLLKSSSRVSGRIICYEMPEETYMELDTPSDWKIVEGLLLEQKFNKLNPSLRDKLKKIKLLVMDVDGVLTDAGMYYAENGDELKKFNTKDGKGIELVRNMGIKVALITSEKTSIVERRAKKLKIDFLIQGANNKANILRELIADYKLSLTDIAYIGDDINDLDALEMVGFSATPCDGVVTNRRIASYVCTTKGGEGCVREICDLLVEARET